MKIEAIKTIRSPELTKDVGDIFEVDDVVALKLIEAGAAKQIILVKTEEIDENVKIVGIDVEPEKKISNKINKKE